MPLAVCGLNHRTAPLAVRERFAIGRAALPAAIARVRAYPGAEEVVLLSTCNRTELYVVVDRPDRPLTEWLGALASAGGAEDAAAHFYVLRERDAVRHLFRVASGLDSLVLGEAQIQGQVRDAYAAAADVETPAGPAVGPRLHRCFQHALFVGGRVRNETEVGWGAASIATAALELARKIFGSLRGRRALVLGAGEMSELVLACFRAEGVDSTVVASRTYERAAALARRWGGDAATLAALPELLRGVDLVLCSTAAPHPVLTEERFREAFPEEPDHPLCILDLAVPRDVAPAIGRFRNVFLYDLDDLQRIVEAALDRRRDAVPQAEAIIAEEVEAFWSWYTALDAVPTIRALRDWAEELRRAEVETVLRRLPHADETVRAALEQLSRSLVQKLLHRPTVRLREAASTGQAQTTVDTVRFLFELDSQSRVA